MFWKKKVKKHVRNSAVSVGLMIVLFVGTVIHKLKDGFPQNVAGLGIGQERPH